MNKNIYKGNMIFHRMVIDPNGNIRYNSNEMKNELRYLKPYEASIITKLRTECINLNDYKYFRFKDENRGELNMCRYCNVPETVEHYLIDCAGQTDQMALRYNPMDTNYNASRNILKARLRRIDSFFRNRSNFNVQNLLFPHTWQVKPSRDDQYYKNKMNRRLNRRIFIFKEIIEYVHRTMRFRRERFGI